MSRKDANPATLLADFDKMNRLAQLYILNVIFGREQSTCGSCWAVAVGSMVSDRLCIRRSELGKNSPHPHPEFMASEADILACSKQGEYVNFDLN